MSSIACLRRTRSSACFFFSCSANAICTLHPRRHYAAAAKCRGDGDNDSSCLVQR
jgi:hypothetical protein